MKASMMSLLDTALEAGMTVSERLKPIWQPLWQLLPSWLTGLIIWTLKWFLGLATMLALVLYRNQNAMLYHPEIAGMVRDPAGNPPRLRNPSEWLEVINGDSFPLEPSHLLPMLSQVGQWGYRRKLPRHTIC